MTAEIRTYKATGENAALYDFIYDLVLQLPIVEAICPTRFVFIESFDEIFPATALSLRECGQWELPQFNRRQCED
jgi:hypothetical protein